MGSNFTLKTTLLVCIQLILLNQINTFGHQLNDSLLKNINEDVRNYEYGKISSIVVLNQKGKTIYSQYYMFHNKNTLNQISSVCKSITSILTGICIEKEYIKSIDTPIYTYFPEYDSIFRHDTLKRQITVEHLLKQTCGLKWEEWKFPYNYASNSLISVLESGENWIEHFLNLSIDTIPGKKISYNSLATQILAEIMQRTTGISFDELVRTYYFNPLNITQYQWEEYPNNSWPAWGGLSLTTNDMAKLGVLILNHGKYNCTQVVDSSWISKSTVQRTSYNDTTGYAMHWWIDRTNTQNPIIYAAGYGDQYVYVLKDKGIIIAINAQNFFDYRWPKSIFDLVNKLGSAIQPDGQEP